MAPAGGNLLTILDGGVSTTPRISSLLIKPVSAVCNIDCAYCFYLDRTTDPYHALPVRRMSDEVLERLVDTYLFYSYPHSVMAFQGGEPTLAGLSFFEKLVAFEEKYGRNGQTVSNSLQTNGLLLDERWCQLFREYHWLVGLSLDGPEDAHDRFRLGKQGEATWSRVAGAVELLQRHQVEFNVLCVLSQANVERPLELYRFFRSLGIAHIQYIPLSEFDAAGNPLPYTILPEQYGRFLVETFDVWWPERRKVRIRYFDAIATALAGERPPDCTLYDSCDSYVVVEHNGDVYPCDFFVESGWKLGNAQLDSWPEIARRLRRFEFAAKKSVPHPVCNACEWRSLCHGGCPKHRHARNRRFEDLDYFCAAYKALFARAVEPLKRDVATLRAAPDA